MAGMTTDQVLSELSSGAVDAFLAAGDFSADAVHAFLAGLPEAQRVSAAQALVAGGVSADIVQNSLDTLTWKFPKWLAAVLGIATGIGVGELRRRRKP